MQRKQQKSVRHHYIPEFYLRHWLDPNRGQLVEFSRPRPNGPVVDRWKYPKATGYENNLYTIPGLPEKDQTVIEDKFFKIVDNTAADAVRKLILDGELNDSRSRSTFCRLIISLLRRNPEYIRYITDQWDILDQKSMEDVRINYNTYKKEGDPSTYEEMLSKSDPHRKHKIFYRLFSKLICSEEIASHMINMIWKVIKNTGNFNLLTSDRPVLISKGAIHIDFHICISLDPQHLFVATNNMKTMSNITRSNKVFKNYNDIICKQSSKYIYASDLSQRRFIENRLGKYQTQFFIPSGQP